MRYNTVCVCGSLAIACSVWVGCSSDNAAESTSHDAGSGGAGGGAGAAGVGGAAGAAGAAGEGGQNWFDPATSMQLAFMHARQEANKSFPDPLVSFVDATGFAPVEGADYGSYRWSYTFVADEGGGGSVKGISLAYPGWSANTIDGTPLGAYVEESEFSNKVKVGFSEMVGHAEQAGVSADSCVDPEAQTPIDFIVTLRGSTNPSFLGWFWEFFCPGDMKTYRFDAGTGEQVIN